MAIPRPEAGAASERAVRSRDGAGAEDADLTRLLRAWAAGDRRAEEAVLPLVYGELRRIAASAFRGRPEDTFQPTALVHEAYLRFVEGHGAEWANRAHFFGSAARAMRQILVDHYRRKRRRKRGGGASALPLCDDLLPALERAPDLERLDDALRSLEAAAPELAAVVEVRYFGGLTLDEAADYLDVSRPTVARRWRRARAWLYDELRR
jgi:RNA polymerase sigma factor (TIGR02999 family)